MQGFHDRGRGDYLGSRDLEDVIAVVDGRQELLGELRAAESDVRSYIAHELRKLYDTPEFQDALPGHLPPDAASQELQRKSYETVRLWKVGESVCPTYLHYARNCLSWLPCSDGIRRDGKTLRKPFCLNFRQ